MNSNSSKKSRWIKRLTPMTRMGKANEKGLEEVSKAVLEPHFHAEGVTAKKVCIRLLTRSLGSHSHRFCEGLGTFTATSVLRHGLEL